MAYEHRDLKHDSLAIGFEDPLSARRAIQWAHQVKGMEGEQFETMDVMTNETVYSVVFLIPDTWGNMQIDQFRTSILKVTERT